ncbi:DNA cytosine methyltransferase [soil metagenome]
MCAPRHKMARPQVVELFSGTGGFTLGSYRAGFQTALAVEIDPMLGSSYSRNFPGALLLEGDVTRLSAVPTLRMLGMDPGEIAGIVGGPPCQGFSDIGHRNPDDPRNGLVAEFFRWVRAIRPPFYVMENVPGLLSADFAHILRRELVRTRGYTVVGPMIVDAAEYGAATRRRRVIVIGYRRGAVRPVDQAAITAARLPTQNVRAAIADLSSPAEAVLGDDGHHWGSYRVGVAPSSYAERAREVPPDGLGSENARNAAREARTSGFQVTRHTRPVLERWTDLKQGSKDEISKAQRLSWDRPAPTLRAGTGPDRGSFQAVRPIHPVEPRVITVREAARVQGFPDWFEFHTSMWHSFRMIGNSVSPYVAEAVLGALRERLEG